MTMIELIIRRRRRMVMKMVMNMAMIMVVMVMVMVTHLSSHHPWSKISTFFTRAFPVSWLSCTYIVIIQLMILHIF